MEKARTPANEKERIEALQEYAILDTLPEPDFDGITKLASAICSTPVSLITFIGEKKQVFKSRYGTNLTENQRDTSFCGHAIHSKEAMIVPDARKDRRFYDNPAVTDGLQVVFYAGIPLVDKSGYALGTLCVIDREVRNLDENQVESLKILANQVVQLLELRKKKAELKESKSAYKSLFEQNPDAVFSFGLNGRFLSANDALLNMVEAPAEALHRTTFARYVSAEYIDLVTKSFQQAVKGNPQNYDVEIISAKGKRLRVNITNIPNISDGKIIGVYGIAKDITEKEQSTEQFRNSEQKTRLIMNAALDAIMWIDPAGMITFWNPQSEKTFGWKKEEAIGQNLIELIAPEKARPTYSNAIRNFIEKGEETALNIMVEQAAVNKAGEEFPIELTVIPIRQNTEISFCVFIRNISERKRFSNELRLSEKRYRDLFYLSPLPMWVYDMETLEFLDVNDAAVRHYGYSYEEFMSMTLDELRPCDELGTFEKAVSFVKKSVVFHRGDFRHVRKDGSIIDDDVQSNVIDYDGRDARLILSIDITRERENERKLKSMTQSLEQKVIERTIELNEANQLLSYEHQQTRDSITYAQNIQSSILHRENDIRSMFMDSFVLFKPKDKVSGDFFWCHETDDHYLVAVVDCTGHGVPGAMISMVGFQLLNQIVLINGETSPSAVLGILDKEVNNLFHQNKEEFSIDGMDMVFCRISKHKKELHFAGAQRPLFIFNSEGLQELKGSKLAIGGYTRYKTSKDFTEHKVEFEPGDCIYLTTDGYYSQFGGPDDKIMLKKRLKLKLEEVAPLSAEGQMKELKNYFEHWQGAEEQVDDVLVMGLKMK